MSESEVEPPKRKGQRRDVEFGAYAERPDGRQVVVTVSNLSYDGCQLSADETFWAGERVTLNLPRRGRILAEIRWCAEGKAGASFIADDETSK